MPIFDWSNWDGKSDKQQKEDSGWLYGLGETLRADGDGHGAADWWHDLTHRDGGQDANRGAAAGIELTQEEGMRVKNGALDVVQGIAGGVLGAVGLEEAATALNAGIDGLQGAASRSTVEQVYGAATVRKADAVAAFIQDVGWKNALYCVSLLARPDVQAAIGVKADFNGVFRSLYEPMYYLHPEIWRLPGAPAIPTLGGSLGSSLGGAVGAVAGTVVRFK